MFPKGKCIDHTKVHLGPLCDDVVRWTFWIPSPNITSQYSSTAGKITSATRREFACGLAYPKCNSEGEPTPICKEDCKRWQGNACYGIHSTYDEDCTPVAPIAYSNLASPVNPAIMLTVFVLLACVAAFN